MHLGHVQHLSVANFDPARPGLERVVVMFHGAEGIVALLDEQHRVLRKTERYAAGALLAEHVQLPGELLAPTLDSVT